MDEKTKLDTSLVGGSKLNLFPDLGLQASINFENSENEMLHAVYKLLGISSVTVQGSIATNGCKIRAIFVPKLHESIPGMLAVDNFTIFVEFRVSTVFEFPECLLLPDS